MTLAHASLFSNGENTGEASITEFLDISLDSFQVKNGGTRSAPLVSPDVTRLTEPRQAPRS